MFPTLQEIKTNSARSMAGLKKGRKRIDWVMIAGNGEPTLHPQFPEAVNCLLELRDEFLPGVPVGILSNSSTCHLPTVLQALSRLDGRYMKLDAGSLPDTWVIKGLRDLKNTVLQCLFFEGVVRNTSPSQIREWLDAVYRIRPQAVQIYTIDRPTQLKGLRRVPKRTLRRIAHGLFASTNIPAETY